MWSISVVEVSLGWDHIVGMEMEGIAGVVVYVDVGRWGGL